MKNSIKKTLVLFGSLFIASQVSAGAKVPQPVSSSPSFILGNFGDARNSASVMEYIAVEDYGTTMYVVAVAASGSWANCYTNNPTFMTQLRSAKSDSQIRANISAGMCTSIYVNNSSRNTVKS